MVDLTSQLSLDIFHEYFKENELSIAAFDTQYFIQKKICVLVTKKENPTKFAWQPDFLIKNYGIKSPFGMNIFFSNLMVKYIDRKK